MPYEVRGKCVYKKKGGKKVGCTKGPIKKYLAALHAAEEDPSENIDEVILREFVRETILVEKKKKKKKKKFRGYHPEESYEKASIKDLYLDRPTSHGGWPRGPSKSYMSNKPVNVQISDWLKSMHMLEQVDSDPEVPIETRTKNGNLIFSPSGLSPGDAADVVYFYPGINKGRQSSVAKMIRSIRSEGREKSRVIVLASLEDTNFEDLKNDADSFFSDHDLTHRDQILGGFSAGSRGVKKALESPIFSQVWLADPEIGRNPESHWPDNLENVIMIYNNPGEWPKEEISADGWQNMPWLAKRIHEMGGQSQEVDDSHLDIAIKVLGLIL